jgi:hypothetical protein
MVMETRNEKVNSISQKHRAQSTQAMKEETVTSMTSNAEKRLPQFGQLQNPVAMANSQVVNTEQNRNFPEM